MTTPILDLPIATIEKALDLRKKIEALKSSLNHILGGASEVGIVAKRRGRPPKAASVASPIVKVDGRKGKRSPATTAKMKAAAKARWAKKKGVAPATPVLKTKKKRTMSPEARAKIAAAQKARWAKQKAA